MAALFVLTTPGGVALGLGIKTTYNDSSPAALAVSGIFDSVSTGILIYMALVRENSTHMSERSCGLSCVRILSRCAWESSSHMS